MGSLEFGKDSSFVLSEINRPMAVSIQLIGNMGRILNLFLAYIYLRF